jgi:DNA-directed RNA polymerase subunit RPC12/RpoP
MIDSILNLIFRCSHRRLTRPVAPVSKAGQPRGKSYVVCLDCGKHFEYDLKEMKMGKAIDSRHGSSVAPAEKQERKSKWKYGKYALMAGVLVGAFVKGRILRRAP